MKAFRRFALAVLPVVVCACTSPKAKKKSTSIFSSSESKETSQTSDISHTSQTSNTSNTSHTSAVSSSGVAPVPSAIIDNVSFTVKDVEVKTNKYQYVTLDYIFADGIDEEKLDEDTLLEYKSGTFASQNSSIATVSQVGKVTGVTKGQTTITFTTKYDSKVAILNVYVYDDSTVIVRKWVKMGPSDTIASGDQIIIGCPQENKAASMNDAEHNHLDVVDVTYNADQSEITETNDAGKFIVGDDYKGRGGLTLEIPERSDGRVYLCATNVRNIEFMKTAKTTQALWEIFYHNEDGFDDWIICSHVDSIDGAMMYNVTNPQFNIYQSSEIEHAMYYIAIYKLHTSFQFN